MREDYRMAKFIIALRGERQYSACEMREDITASGSIDRIYLGFSSAAA